MKFINSADIRKRMNEMGRSKDPFLFMISYDCKSGFVVPLDELAENDIYCHIRDMERGKICEDTSSKEVEPLKVNPVRWEIYKEALDKVRREINYGNSYLLNLTFSTPVETNLSLLEIYQNASALYKLCLPDRFVFYSPEPFVRIVNQKIYSYPMKGTIDASQEDAERILMSDQKELNEHHTIVDLIRNDLAIVSRDVRVDKFRYVETIKTPKGDILQTSSEISGHLSEDWNLHLGDIFFKLLPAGSITGAPKLKTVEIIEGSEPSPRGFYTGVMGIFDGTTVDSCVAIRFLERMPDGSLVYHSGGGITSMSDARSEYEELKTKIYVPIH